MIYSQRTLYESLENLDFSQILPNSEQQWKCSTANLVRTALTY